ncbi:MAG: DUF1308 domain-containing protein [Anaerolineae bacterium]
MDIQPGLHVVLSETQGANVTRHIHGLRGIHAHKDAANNWEHPLQDGLGSVREVVDNSVAVLESRNYDPFGTGFGNTGTSQTNYGFTGELVDGGGLLDLRARRYAPGVGVFASLDPLETPNRYAYVSGNPINRTDPSGLFDGATLGGIGVPALTACALTPVCQEILLGVGIVVVVGAAAYVLRNEIADMADGLARGFSNIAGQLDQLLQLQGAQLNAMNREIQRTLDCLHTAPPNRPATCGGTVVLPPGAEEAIENALDDSVIRRLRRWWWNFNDPGQTPDPNETPGPGTGPIGTPTPAPSPAQTPTQTPSCTPTPTPTPVPQVNLDTGSVYAFVSQGSPLASILSAYVAGRQMVITQTALSETVAPLTNIAGPMEKARAATFLAQVLPIADNPSARARALRPTNNLQPNDIIIFGTGDQMGIETITSDAKAQRAAVAQGVNFWLYVHPPVSLTGR